MQERATNADDWIGAWIAQQRELLGRQAAPQGEGGFTDLARQWAETSQAFFDGLRQHAQRPGADPQGGSFDPFSMTNTLFGSWSSATLMQSSMAESLAEMLRRLPPIG